MVLLTAVNIYLKPISQTRRQVSAANNRWKWQRLVDKGWWFKHSDTSRDTL